MHIKSLLRGKNILYRYLRAEVQPRAPQASKLESFQNSQKLKPIKYCCKALLLRYLRESWLNLCRDIYNFVGTKHVILRVFIIIRSIDFLLLSISLTQLT